VFFESLAEEQKTRDALVVLNTEINAVLQTWLERRNIDPKKLAPNDLTMIQVEGEPLARDFYYKNEIILKVRGERKTNGEVRFHLIHEGMDAEPLLRVHSGPPVIH